MPLPETSVFSGASIQKKRTQLASFTSAITIPDGRQRKNSK